MPALLAVVLFLVYQASQTPGWGQAKNFFFQVDWSRLWSGQLWGFAFGQAFYTLAIGQGYLVTYGSFIPRKTHLPRACLTVAGVETSVALLAGWMIFPFVFSFGLEPGQGSALSFTPLEWRIAGEPVLDVIDRIAGGDVIIFSGVTGAALLCWFIPPQRIRTVLGTANRWWEWRIYLVGRYLPLLVVLWAVLVFAVNQAHAVSLGSASSVFRALL